MTRGSAALALVLAVVAGLLGGVLLYYRVGPIPLSASAGGPSTSPTGGPPASGDPGGSGRPSGPTSPSGRPSGSPSGRPTPQAGPAFTERALLQTQELLDAGWGSATVTQSWTGLPPDQITSCSPVLAADGAPFAAYASTYRGVSTTAAEIVVRYYDDAAARVAMQKIIDRIATCRSPAEGQPALTVERLEPPAHDGITELYLWDTTGAPSTEGVIALARAGDRIALLSMVSTTSDPVETTKIGALALQAGRRLV